MISAMSDRDFMVKILNNLPPEYDVILDGLENRLILDESDSNALTIESIRDKINNCYEHINAQDKIVEEKAHYANYKKPYKGRCLFCGEYGHKSGDCPEKKKPPERADEVLEESSNGFKGECWYCNKNGHKAGQCKKLMADMLKKRNAEGANVAIDEVNDSDTERFVSLSKLGF